ncbi:MAG TPA: zinc ribbon domain-containing protein [Anaerolineae bacterium]|nr:zinc ribbon domain-containing protein [Anaerolineae bacterium]
MPPIVSCELWQAAQDKREYNKQMSARNTKNAYLLRGMIKCGCGRSRCARMAHNRPWYRCSSRAYQQKGLEVLCDEKGVNGPIVEAFAWEYALMIITERDKLLPPAEKRRWMEYLKIRVEVKEHKATASTMLKVEPRTIDLGTSRSPGRSRRCAFADRSDRLRADRGRCSRLIRRSGASFQK